ncbi:peptidase domain-containing ABC transporter [Chitinophaga sp. S165]|uniref:peptidase domain-containing ABC transporter n=1 Tax=Chitinophaga sp. S165 TaxID=2135462 RepID=UPI000D70BE30|nr:peptidase domain-containing ABC transporter [Chitinophaga sp. S165]PWV51820.1 ATP-binding cassette subfamily B protein [Chitinophaga sp. S165]
MRFKSFIQHDIMDCGPSCIKMIAAYYGKSLELDYLRELCYLNKNGVSLGSMNHACERLGFRTFGATVTFTQLMECPLPCILHWNQDHFVVLYNVKRKQRWLGSAKDESIQLYIADPAHGSVEVDKETFLKSWISSADGKGVVLLLEPTPEFYALENASADKKGYSFLLKYLFPHKRYILQLLAGMLSASAISLVLPFLAQFLIDYGVKDADLTIVYLILLSQLFLFFGSTAIDMIQNWLLLHVNVRISLNIISDFLIKLLKLPIKYFDTKAVGDITQRINDHHRIETFLTSSLLSSLFSMINITVFSIVLALYDVRIFGMFLVFSIGAVVWIFLFRQRRKRLDYKRFSRNKQNQDKLFEMITGMQDIKLYGSETPRRWEWEQLQLKLFKLNISSLALEQYQRVGFVFLSQVKNILISFLAAREVINGHFSIGVLLSISYIIGQTNGPLEQLVSFVKAAQDARLSMDRMQEIHNRRDEQEEEVGLIQHLEDLSDMDVSVENVSFQYGGPNSAFVLKDVSFTIPHGKVTAIVGASGSGKSTLMKLLLNFYKPTSGTIFLGDEPLENVSSHYWRTQCGTVTQDAYIFYDTIARNIALDGKPVDHERMQYAVSTANIREFIEELPLGYTTKIGNNGLGISGGQKQRIFIARAVYKDPQFLFFDEATSSLDANNERTIMENLERFFKGKTVVVIAHRLSTVRNADQIIVLDKGEITETGTHDSLSMSRGYYYELVKNQLELGN